MQGIIRFDGNPAQCVVRSHRRSTGEVIDETTSNEDGTFDLALMTSEPCYAIAFHPNNGNYKVFDMVQDNVLFLNYIFIDESNSSYYPNDYDWSADYNNAVNAINAAKKSAGVYNLVVKLSHNSDIIPQGVNWPLDIAKRVDVDRHPPLQLMKDEFEGIIESQLGRNIEGGATTVHVKFWVDGSGSMTVNTINPEYDDFINWVQTNYSSFILEQDTGQSNERWLHWIYTMINSKL